MKKKYLSKIIANDNEGLQIISACCSGAKLKVGDIKYLNSSFIRGITDLPVVAHRK